MTLRRHRPPPRRPGRTPPRRQRGEIVLVTLVFLLVSLLGLMVSMRDGIVNTMTVGNNLARQKGVQVADIALRQVESRILAAYAGMPLQLSAGSQAWWRDVSATTPAPAPGYWDACLGNADATRRCASIALAVDGRPLPYTAYAVVQPTGRSDATSCSLAQYMAVYYAIHLHVKEANGATAVDTETVYRLCILA
jgi:hypothetical protein